MHINFNDSRKSVPFSVIFSNQYFSTWQGEANNGTASAVASSTVAIPSDPTDPFAEEDDNENEKLKNMARKFEEKYVSNPRSAMYLYFVPRIPNI